MSTKKKRTGLGEWFWQIRAVPLGIIIVLMLALVVAGLVIDLLPDTPPFDRLAGVKKFVRSDSFPAWAGLLEVILLVTALLLTGFHFRQERAARFIERFNSPDVIQLRGMVDGWLSHYERFSFPLRKRLTGDDGEPLSEDERLALDHSESRLLLELDRNPQLDKSLKGFANLFQELGQAFENKTVSPRYTKRMFDYLAPHYWDVLQCWILRYREESDPMLYSRFESLAEGLRSAPPKPGEEPGSESGNPDAGYPTLDRLAVLREAKRVRRHFVFGYGSLVNRVSRGRVVKDDGALRVADLSGYERSWQTVETVEFLDGESAGRIRPVVFLDLALSQDGMCNGVLIPMDEDGELEDMDRREKNYVRVDVTPWIAVPDGTLPPGSRVFTYIGRPQFTLPPYGTFGQAAVPGAVAAVDSPCVAEDYVRLLEVGLRDWDEDFVAQFHANTLPRPASLPTVKGKYRFTDPEQNRTTGRDRLA